MTFNNVSAAWSTPTLNGDDSGFYSYLLDLLEPPAWHNDAACKGLGHDTFYPSRGNGIAARRICATCTVVAECSEASRDEHDGIWAGTSPEERGRARGRPVVVCGTPAGYERHRRLATLPCQACVDANRVYRRYKRQRSYNRRREAGWCNRCAWGAHKLCPGRTLAPQAGIFSQDYVPCECPQCAHKLEGDAA